ncbi:dihydrodipicolinate synthase family protein [Conexibacter arvalis]|uniref:4-hydroxy-tetrahydrodipicolinate synthase n=1 Tax=Conexibacter arvalis TaxID=912552 RepID=A0A840IG89_9ACTN|nr:dihydrodipicolinate synthase family protein [Conexibacter arvalis]MBB4663084.1 4-hydroxy-tetrahydrodipicolinate synthase [Conexibacter arvalis]
MTAPIAGLHVPLVTPFDPDGRVDLAALRRLAERCLADGAEGLVALGTTGEAFALGAAEQEAVVACCAEICAERGAALTVGVGGSDTAGVARAAARHGGRAGVTAIMSSVPPYVRPSRAGIAAHFRALAEASPVPLIAYEHPPRTGVRFGADALLELHAAEPRVVGVKLSVPVLDGDALALLAGAPSGFGVLAGEDALMLAALVHGAVGAIAAAANCATDRFAALVRTASTGELAEARRVHDTLLPLVRALYAEPSPSVVKGLLHRRGEIATPAVRLPLVPASAGAVEAALHALEVAEGAAVPA